MAKKRKKAEQAEQPTQRDWPMSPVYFVLVGLCLFCWVTFVALGTYQPMQHQVAGIDPVGYYAWAHSIFFDHDLDFTNDYQAFHVGDRDDDSYLTIGGMETPIGRVGNVFAMGAGLLWIPFLMVAHLMASMGDGPANGFGQIYFTAVSFANLFYGCAGLFLMFGALRRWFSDGVAGGASIAAWMCSPVLYYTFAQVTMSHACSFFGVALALYAWARWREQDEWWKWGLIGIAVGIATIIRWQNITVALVIAVDILGRRDLKHWPKALASGLGALIAFSPQMIAWKVLYGSFLTVPQGSGFMQWTRPDVFMPLFSLKYGLITWTPLCGLGIIGMFLLPKERRLVFGALLVAFAVQMYVQFATGDAGWSFSSRRMCNLVPFFAVGMALVYTRVRVDWRIAVGVVSLFAVWNYLFVLQYGGILDEFYVQRALDGLMAEHNMSFEQIASAQALPDGTPFNLISFAEAQRFPRGLPPTWTQMTFDKLHVLGQIGRKILLIGT